MADFLTINQYPVSIANREAGGSRLPIGGERQAWDGSWINTRRAFKRAWKLKTPPLTETEGWALARLLAGEGHHWSFADASDFMYSSKGLPQASGSTPTRTATSGKFGAYITIAAAGQVGWDTGYDYLTTTAMVWWYTGAAWHHYIVCGNGYKWVDGVRNDGASTPFLSVNSNGRLLLGDTGSGIGQDFDDLVVLPFLVSASMAEAWGVMTAAFSALPKLTIAGDMIPGTSTTCVCVDDVGWEYVQGVIGGSWAQNGHVLSFELREA